eukprot:TRINITY_DN21225_c0_g1_i3.p1 TRINITY_DN21225_c0_g1~~TRINITY_DN21225_c0_g1_i3.p1  ORF type:complete len:326 (+),score=46.44 TRINITY_DN21225_c0_g1_i3:112-1089(+)
MPTKNKMAASTIGSADAAVPVVPLLDRSQQLLSPIGLKGRETLDTLRPQILEKLGSLDLIDRPSEKQEGDSLEQKLPSVDATTRDLLLLKWQYLQAGSDYSLDVLRQSGFQLVAHEPKDSAMTEYLARISGIVTEAELRGHLFPTTELFDELESEKNKGVIHVFLHPPVYTCHEADAWSQDGSRGENVASMKNLFVKEKKKNCIGLGLVSAMVSTEVAFKSMPNLKQPSFAPPEVLCSVLGLLPGSVTPFGLLNYDSTAASAGHERTNTKDLQFFLDPAVEEKEFVAFHPNSCAATLRMRTEEFVDFMEQRFPGGAVQRQICQMK